jgi:hypothetical protein
VSESITIATSNGFTVKLDAEDLPKVAGYRWHAAETHKCNVSKFYAMRASCGKTTYLHRIIAGAKAGDIVDHINGDSLDNRKANLRIVDASANAANRTSVNSTGYRGVSARPSGKYRAVVQRYGRRYSSGPHNSALDAAQAYDRIAMEVYGDLAVLNFPRAEAI